MNTPNPPDEHLPRDVQALAVHVLGSQTLANEWLNNPAVALNGRRPCELLATDANDQAVRDLLMRIEYGVYS